MDNIEPALLNFINTKLDSFLKWDLLRFFHENPHTTDTAANIAKYVGRDVTAVEPEMEDLVKFDVMQKYVLAETSIYSLSADESVRTLLGQFILASEEKEFRTKMVQSIIRKAPL